jgi:hypothetical protein
MLKSLATGAISFPAIFQEKFPVFVAGRRSGKENHA